MAKPYCLHIPREHYEAMLAQAHADLPNECCGLLAGTIQSSKVGAVTHRFPLANAADSPQTEYLSEPRSMFAAVRSMRELGVEILAIYHSHPTSAAIPSRKDRERSYCESVVNVIISLAAGQLAVRAWWLTANEATEADWVVVDAMPKT